MWTALSRAMRMPARTGHASPTSGPPMCPCTSNPAFQRRGIGRALYASLFACLMRQGFYNLYAGITLPNPASAGLHEAVGFEPIGIYRSTGYKCGAWHDVGWWQLALRTDRDTAPPDPRPLPEAMQDADWPSLLNAGLPLLRL